MDLKLLSTIGAAGAAGDSAIGVEDVCKTYLYEGNQTAKSINTGLDMTDGGMVWIKNRDNSWSHRIWDTERGSTKFVYPNDSNAQENDANGTTATMLESFNNNGFSVGQDQTYGGSNYGDSFVSWSFKKQEKFFTIKTYSGTGSTQTLTHDLGSIPGAIFVKRTDTAADWGVYHRGQNGGTDPEDYRLKLNSSTTQNNDTYWGDTAPTESAFTVGDAHSEVNASGGTYVAYLFAHEEAEFGPNSDQKIISCGSYTGTGSAGLSVTLPFEPQWILLKNASATGDWRLFDSMRGIVTGGNDAFLGPNQSDSEYTSVDALSITPTGFKIENTATNWNGNGNTIIYIAIAAETGKTMKAITTGTDVFAMDTGNSSASIPSMDSNFAVDMAIYTKPASTSHNWLTARLIGQKELKINGTDTEGSVSDSQWDSNVGWGENHNSTYQSWLWKRSAGFDCLTYKATGVIGLQINHNLGVIPEMLWCKRRDGSARDWMVYHKGLNGGTTPEQHYLVLNSSDAEGDSANRWNDTAPTASVVTLGSSQVTNDTGLSNFIMMLFSTVSGISKCGYHTCGAGNVTLSMDFSPRFLLLKNISTGSTPWVVIDTLRGITANAGNTPTFNLSSEWGQSNYTWIQSISSSGIEIKAGQGDRFSNDGDNFIWYAHA